MKQSIHNSIKVGISGKRDIVNSNQVKEKITQKIQEILNEEEVEVVVGYSAIAVGADSIFAEIVKRQLGQQLKIILPFDELEYCKDFENKNDVDSYNAWLQQSDYKEVVTKVIPRTEGERNEAYFSTGKYIVDHVDYMIIIWDELKPRGKGGTAEILGYASKKIKPEKLFVIKDPSQRDDINKEVKLLLKESDEKAKVFKRKHENTWIYSIRLGLAAVFCFAVYTSIHLGTLLEIALVGVELVCLAIVFLLISIARKKSYHSNLLKHRLRAEKIRLLDVYYHSDNKIEISEITAAEDNELASVAQRSNNSVGKKYNSNWYKYFVINFLITDQLSYHYKKINNKIGKRPSYYKVIATVGYVFFLIILSFHLGNLCWSYFNMAPIFPYTYNHSLGLFLSIILPPSFAAVQAWVHFNEWDELKKQSLKMIAYLEEQKIKLDTSDLNDDIFSKILNAVSAAMLADNRDWNIVVSKNIIPHPII